MHQWLAQELGLPSLELFCQTLAGSGHVDLGSFGQQCAFKDCHDGLRDEASRILVKALRSLEHHGQALAQIPGDIRKPLSTRSLKHGEQRIYKTLAFAR